MMNDLVFFIGDERNIGQCAMRVAVDLAAQVSISKCRKGLGQQQVEWERSEPL